MRKTPFFPISNSFSPNIENDDVWLCFKLLLKSLFEKEDEKKVREFEKSFSDFFGGGFFFSFDSGRSALFLLLKSLDIKENDEVLVQAFTCNAVLNPILKNKARPIFVDIDESFNLDPKDLEKKITKNSKAVIVQHTFGQPARLDEIKKICQKYGLYLIEDCAHSLGASFFGKKVGSFGDASFFSFGRDKIITSIFGGGLLTFDEKIAKKVQDLREKLPFSPKSWTIRQLLYPIIYSFSLPLFSFFSLGKGILFLARKMGLLLPAVFEEEKKGKLFSIFPRKMSSFLSVLGKHQLKKLNRFNRHREKIANFYYQALKDKKGIIFQKSEKGRVYMRFPILTKKADFLIKKAKKENIYFDDGWHGSVVLPKGTLLQKVGYKKGSCKKAEEISKNILNLPTHIHIGKKEAKKVVDFVLKNI